jgi:AcrR family transcriptional regulator
MGKGEQTRTSILEQAVAMASIHGLDGLSIGRLAARTGMSKSGLFGHFGSKDALQRAVLETAIEDFKVRVIAPALRERTGEARLRRLFSGWLDWAIADEKTGGCPLMSASIELDDQPGPLRDYLVAQQVEWLDCIRRMTQKAVSEGKFRAGLDTRQLAFEFQSIGLGFNFAFRLLDDPQAPARARAAFDSLIQKAKV